MEDTTKEKDTGNPMKGIEDINKHLVSMMMDLKSRLQARGLTNAEEAPLVVTKILCDMAGESHQNLVAICFTVHKEFISIMAKAMMMAMKRRFGSENKIKKEKQNDKS